MLRSFFFSTLLCLAVILAGCGGGGGSAAAPSPTPTPTPTPVSTNATTVKHIVVIMQENRTFDNLFNGLP